MLLVKEGHAYLSAHLATLGILAATVLLVLLVRANSELDATKGRLEASQVQRERLSSDLGATADRLTSKIAENETLTANLNATTERLTSKIAENETLTADLTQPTTANR